MNIILSLIMTLSLASVNDSVQADLFELEGTKHLFKYEAKRTTVDGVTQYESKYTDATTGDVVAVEKAELKNDQLVRYEVERAPTKEKGLIEVRDGKVYFSYNDGGKKSDAKEPLKSGATEPLIVSANLVPLAEARMADLLAKKDVDFRYAVWYRKETVGFRFSFEKEEGKTVVIRMNPTNFLYKSLVKPLYFTFDKSTKKLLEVRGRTLPKKKEGSSWRDADVLSRYK